MQQRHEGQSQTHLNQDLQEARTSPLPLAGTNGLAAKGDTTEVASMEICQQRT